MFDRIRLLSIWGRPLLASLALVCLSSLAFAIAWPAQDDPDHDLIVQSLDSYRHGDCKTAEPLFEKILLRHPKDISTRKLLGNCYLQEKKMDDAKDQFQLVLDTAPQDVEAFEGLKKSMGEIQKQTLLKQSLAIQSRVVTAEEFKSSHEFTDAEKLIRARRFDEAEKILDGILSRHPDSVPVRQRLAEIYSTTSRFGKAAEMYQVMADRKNSSPAFLLRLAQNLEWDRNFPKAAQNYRLYLQKKPNDSAAVIALARLLMQGGNYPEAAKYYRDYLSKNPQDDVRTALANMLVWSGQYAEAVPEFEALRVSRPQDLQVRLSLARCYQELGEKEKALKAFQESLTLDPGNPTAVKARNDYLTYFDELPRQQAYAALERKDFDAAIKDFSLYAEKHPEDPQILLQIARVCSWAKRYSDAEGYYETYLQRSPHDVAILRELAQMDLWNKKYPEARKYYEQLTRDPSATPDDYEALLQTYTWSGDMAGAQPIAQKLIQLSPNNELATLTLHNYAEQKRLATRTHAEELAAARRYPEAIEAYRQYMGTYGKDPQIELLICRLYSWGKDYNSSGKAYVAYLKDHPQDMQARLELANVESWAGEYGPAQNDYQAVLNLNPKDLDALVGIAQVQDYQLKDPFAIRNSYLNVISADPRNTLAQKRLGELHPLVSPSFTLSQKDFSDSDGVLWSTNSLEITFPLPGRVKITPIYNFGYFRQNLRDLHLSTFENGAGGRIEVANSTGVSFLGELGGTYWSEDETLSGSPFHANRTCLFARAEASFRPDRRGILGLSYYHRDAVYDLTTIQTLAAGIMEDAFFVSYQRPLSERVHLWSTAGVSHYTAGTLPSQYDNTQPRFSARLDYQLRPWITLGYSTRVSGFSNASPIYFSPTLYQTHGLAYTLSKQVYRNLLISADGEASYGRIGTHRMTIPIGVSSTLTGASVNTFEMALVPRLKWRMGHGFTMQMGYRFSQGKGGSALNLPGTLYRTQGGEFSLQKIF